MKKVLLSVAAIFLLAATACSQAETDTSGEEVERVVSVEVAEATKGDLTLERSIFGRTAPNQATAVMLQTPGEVDSLKVKNGDQVKEDKVIATIATAVGKQNIRAPKDGEIVSLHAKEGDMVSNEEPFAIIADLETIQLDFTVTVGVQKLVAVDEILTAVINDEEYEVTITKVDKMPNEAGLYPVTATVDNPDGVILPGMVVQLAIPESQITDAIIVPTAAIIEEDDETFIYVVKNNRAVKQAVNVLAVQSAQSAIEDGVEAGDQLVVTGQLTLSDDVQVDVVKGE
ncbi:efflux RND transporter periplasmic adaptor subunit [Bacillus sp. B15-48]|uniref:efflux RND transporter periplasmic adaptor subunit n=1 Tax=Bacillus sp. B15-48 TaxID=1548601 RepID=UPI00193F2C92|nr:efflux RND transporter periplasmic adaptor subunit [Bacillus sp. B15-48]MBM4760950.1 efflux RND transporter periplasmic adaptor subunit [Bacillus sp. B15-48]